MSMGTGTELAQGIRQKIGELKKICSGIDEAAGSRAPAGRWTPKEVLSHLLGPAESCHVPLLQRFIDEEKPTIAIDPGNPHYSAERAKMTFAQLLMEVEKEYERMAVFAATLSDTDLARRAHLPALKESPLGDSPSLEGLIKGLGQFHVQMHIDQIREILLQNRG